MTDEEAIEIVNSIVKVNEDYLKGVERQTISQTEIEAISIVLQLIEKQREEIEDTKKEYYSLINKIENKIDNFDYKMEKAKRKNDSDKVDYYWDLIGNFTKLLG